MKIKNSNILVIGGAGFIGSFVVAELLKQDVKKVIVYDNFARGNPDYLLEQLEDSRCSVYENGGDIRDIDILNDAVSQVDFVICLAAMWLLHCKDYPRTAFEVNIKGTFNVLEACVKNNTEVDKQELDYLRLNLIYSGKCRKTVFNDGYKIGTEDYKNCILRRGKKIQ